MTYTAKPRSHRGYQELGLVPCSVETGRSRFEPELIPELQDGRNNLTALSHTHSFYFFAAGNEIHVHDPKFPTYKLSDQLFKWRLHETSTSGRIGYINPCLPHAANAILIGKLGNQEIIVCACDDGDVVAYHTAGIQHAINGLEKGLSHEEVREKFLRPVLLENIGRSAWGLAIHTNARKIAASCNTHLVTVWSFTLTDDSLILHDQLPGQLIVDTVQNLEPAERAWQTVLRGHDQNIPNVSFANVDGDKEGRYVASVDLRGVVYIWDVRPTNDMSSNLSRKISPIHRPDQEPVRRLDFQSGWSVVCVDPKSAIRVNSFEELFGCEHPVKEGCVLDITTGRKSVHDSADTPVNQSMGHEDNMIPFIYDDASEELTISEALGINFGERLLQEGEDADEDADMNRYGENEEYMLDVDDESDINVAVGLMGAGLDGTGLDSIGFDNTGHENTGFDNTSSARILNLSGTSSGSESEDEESDPHERPGPTMNRTSLDTDEQMYSYLAGRRASLSNAELAPAYGMSTAFYEDMLDLYGDRRETLPYLPTIPDPNFDPSNSFTRSPPARTLPPCPCRQPREPCTRHSASCPNPDLNHPFAIFHTGTKFALLHQAPFDRPSVIECRNPCDPNLVETHMEAYSYERLHLTHYIPDLSVVITASGSGRAAVFTITRRPAPLTAGQQKYQNGQRIGWQRDEIGMRLDWVLPLASQEQKRERPMEVLVGIATAPLQGVDEGWNGSEVGLRKRSRGERKGIGRWRLMLTYADHTVLSYELWRREREVRVEF